MKSMIPFLIAMLPLASVAQSQSGAPSGVPSMAIPKTTEVTGRRRLMNYPYATFYLEAQRARRNLLHVFGAETDVPVAGPFLLAAKCPSAQARKKKADSRLNLSELLGIHVNS